MTELTEETIANVAREVSRCLRELVSGSGHLGCYTLHHDTFVITRWEGLPNGNVVLDENDRVMLEPWRTTCRPRGAGTPDACSEPDPPPAGGILSKEEIDGLLDG